MSALIFVDTGARYYCKEAVLPLDYLIRQEDYATFEYS
jgi:hypothetical protein